MRCSNCKYHNCKADKEDGVCICGICEQGIIEEEYQKEKQRGII